MIETIYLDHAATTPLDPLVRGDMEPYLSDVYGNPSSIHRLGQRARMAVDEARERVATALGAHPIEIVFTSGGTESDNAAIRGAALAAAGRGGHIVTTAIEHEAVLESCAELEIRHGFEITRVGPDKDGIVSADTIAAAIRPETILVSVMHANNEIGTIQPVAEIGSLCRERRVTFHVDAVQTVGMLSVDLAREPIDLLSISAHKFYGPKGVGLLYVKRGTHWWPQQLGGGQERQRRSGTENVAGIVGMACALNLALSRMDGAVTLLSEMRDHMLSAIEACIPDVVINGSRVHRLPGNLNVSFPGVSGEALVMALDAQSIMTSSGSACSSGSTEPSHVLEAIGAGHEVAGGALRVSLGHENTWREINRATTAIVDTVRRMRAGGGVARASSVALA